MEQTGCSETSAYKIQTSGNYPEESIQQPLSYHNGIKHYHRPVQGSLGFPLSSVVNSSFLMISDDFLPLAAYIILCINNIL